MDMENRSLEMSLQQNAQLNVERNALLQQSNVLLTTKLAHDDEAKEILKRLHAAAHATESIAKEQARSTNESSTTLKSISIQSNKSVEIEAKNSSIMTKLYSGIQDTGKVVGEILLAPIKAISNGLLFVADKIWEGVTAVSKTLLSITKSVGNVLAYPIKLVYNAVKSAATTVFDGISKLTTTVVNVAKSAINTLLLPITTAFKFTKWFLTDTLLGKLTLVGLSIYGIKKFFETNFARIVIDKLIAAKDAFTSTISNALNDPNSTSYKFLNQIVSALNDIKLTIAKYKPTNIARNVLDYGNWIYNAEQQSNKTALLQNTGNLGAADIGGLKFNKFIAKLDELGDLRAKSGESVATKDLFAKLNANELNDVFTEIFSKGRSKFTDKDKFKYDYSESALEGLTELRRADTEIIRSILTDVLNRDVNRFTTNIPELQSNLVSSMESTKSDFDELAELSGSMHTTTSKLDSIQHNMTNSLNSSTEATKKMTEAQHKDSLATLEELKQFNKNSEMLGVKLDTLTKAVLSTQESNSSSVNIPAMFSRMAF